MEEGMLHTKNRVVYGCDRLAREFSLRLLDAGIPFDYFLFPFDNPSFLLPNIMNKPVIDTECARLMEDVKIYVSCTFYTKAREILEKSGLARHIVLVEEMAADIMNASKRVVYGTGKRAEQFLADVASFCEIDCFCDSNPQKGGTLFEKYRVISPDELSDLGRDTAVIIASTYIQEIYDILINLDTDPQNIWIFQHNEIMVWDDSELQYSFGERNFIHIFRELYGKEFVLYGKAAHVAKIKNMFEMAGTANIKCIEASKDSDNKIYDLGYINILEECVLVVDKYSHNIYDIMKNMIGIPDKNIMWLEQYEPFYLTDRDSHYRSGIDVHIGPTYFNLSEEYTSFVKYEYEGKTDRKICILTLGGSTTSAFGTRQASWSEKLSEILKSEKISHIIYCGGIDGYNASMELIKFIRDGIWLRPDIVINYSAANNIGYSACEDFPFVNSYQKKLFDNIIQCFKIEEKDIDFGIAYPTENIFEYWYCQEKMIHAICREFHIVHRTFMQPLLFSKNSYQRSDGECAVLMGMLFDKRKKRYVHVMDCEAYPALLDRDKLFREEGEKMAAEEDWFFDFSHLFDGHDNVYIDMCHVYEKGNEILANAIYDCIKEEVKECVGEA